MLDFAVIAYNDLIIGLFSSHWIQRQSHIGKERGENRGVALQLPFDFSTYRH